MTDKDEPPAAAPPPSSTADDRVVKTVMALAGTMAVLLSKLVSKGVLAPEDITADLKRYVDNPLVHPQLKDPVVQDMVKMFIDVANRAARK